MIVVSNCINLTDYGYVIHEGDCGVNRYTSHTVANAEQCQTKCDDDEDNCGGR